MIARNDTTVSDAIACEFMQEIDRQAILKRPRRIEFSKTDSDLVRTYMRYRNDAHDSREVFSARPFPSPDYCHEFVLRRVPCRLDCPETRMVFWDDYEQWQVLSATCFTPDPKG